MLPSQQHKITESYNLIQLTINSVNSRLIKPRCCTVMAQDEHNVQAVYKQHEMFCKFQLT